MEAETLDKIVKLLVSLPIVGWLFSQPTLTFGLLIATLAINVVYFENELHKARARLAALEAEGKDR